MTIKEIKPFARLILFELVLCIKNIDFSFLYRKTLYSILNKKEEEEISKDLDSLNQKFLTALKALEKFLRCFNVRIANVKWPVEHVNNRKRQIGVGENSDLICE